jgi:hypothetical protein
MNSSPHDSLPEIEAYSQTKQLALLYFATLIGFLLLNYFFNLRTVYFVAMIVGLVVAGIFLVKDWFDKSPRLIINQQGVLDTRLKIGMIRWKDIRRVYGVSLNNIEHICFELHNEDKYLENRSSITNLSANFNKTATGIAPINIVTSNLDVDTNDIFEAISKGCEMYSQPGQNAQ